VALFLDDPSWRRFIAVQVGKVNLDSASAPAIKWLNMRPLCGPLLLLYLSYNTLMVAGVSGPSATGMPVNNKTVTKQSRHRHRILVVTHSGVVEGMSARLSKSEKVFAFLGLPYAEPPIGSRRFQVSNQKMGGHNLCILTFLRIFSKGHQKIIDKGHQKIFVSKVIKKYLFTKVIKKYLFTKVIERYFLKVTEIFFGKVIQGFFK
jgi:Carboxylesterase family